MSSYLYVKCFNMLAAIKTMLLHIYKKYCSSNNNVSVKFLMSVLHSFAAKLVMIEPFNTLHCVNIG